MGTGSDGKGVGEGCLAAARDGESRPRLTREAAAVAATPPSLPPSPPPGECAI